MAAAVELPGVRGADIILTSGASGRVNALLSIRAWETFVRLINVLVLILLLPFRGVGGGGGGHSRRVERDNEKSEVGGVECVKKGKGVGNGGSSSSSSGNSPVLRLPAAMASRRIATSPGSGVELDVIARRAIAIRRVKEDDDDERSVRDFSLFVSPRGVTLFTQSWSPVDAAGVRGVVVLLHGLNEHSGRYGEFAKQLNAKGLKVYGLDWIGHGGSDGLHGFVHSLDDAVYDMKAFLEKVMEQNPGLPCFCFGHSTGGAIILKAALDPKVESRISGIAVTSPAVGVQPSHPIYSVLAPIVAFLFPKYQCGAANKKGAVVSRDPQALVAKYSDPLVYTGCLRVRTGYEILRITAYLQQNLEKLCVPFLVLHGTSDTVTDPKASEKLYVQAASSDKMIRLYDGLLHDLLFEPERETIAQEILQWFNDRV